MNSLLPDWKPTLFLATKFATGSSSHDQLRPVTGVQKVQLKEGHRSPQC